MDAFLKEATKITPRSYVPSERRNIVNRVYEKILTSGNLITTVSGGSRGGTMSLTHGISINVEGVTSSTSQGMSYPVPKNKKGNIVLQTKMKYTEYRMETRIKVGYNNYTKWQYAGSYTVKNVVSNWYEPVYW